MKKLPCLFVREFKPRENGRGQEATITDQVTPGCEAFFHNGKATRKWDGTACMVKDHVLYKRYDAKKGKTPPAGAIPCSEPDPITGHWPHWVKVDAAKPEDKWHAAAWERERVFMEDVEDGTYELCGPHFSANPERFDEDTFIPHGEAVITDLPRSFEGVRNWLAANNVEGIVFWYRGEPACKIRRADFGLPWGNKR